jgi:hypothetical protein
MGLRIPRIDANGKGVTLTECPPAEVTSRGIRANSRNSKAIRLPNPMVMLQCQRLSIYV